MKASLSGRAAGMFMVGLCAAGLYRGGKNNLRTDGVFTGGNVLPGSPFGVADLWVDGLLLGVSSEEDALAALGRPDETAKSDGKSARTLLYPFGALLFQPDDQGVNVLEKIIWTHNGLRAPRGITVGMSAADALSRFPFDTIAYVSLSEQGDGVAILTHYAAEREFRFRAHFREHRVSFMDLSVEQKVEEMASGSPFSMKAG